MSDIDKLQGRVEKIATELRNVIRSEPTNTNHAGWGQFVEATSNVYQIGPYGTSSGLLAIQIAFPKDIIDLRVKNILRSFWNEKPNGKLFPQNVRLAFMILAFAKTSDPELAQLRDEIASELRVRQLSDGSWSDAVYYSGAPVGGQVDATAWVTLALVRTGGYKNETDKAALWLAQRANNSGTAQLLSPIGVAAAISAHPQIGNAPGLKQLGFKILENNSINREEGISFFDYEETSNGVTLQKRDYLCFPAFYPLCILINKLSRNAGFFEMARLDICRMDAIQKLNEIADDRTYKQPTAKYSSTVDQAVLALSYQELREAQDASLLGVSIGTPLYRWSKDSIILRLILPLILLSTALVTINEPSTVPSALKDLFGFPMEGVINFSTQNKSSIQLITGVLLALLPTLPKSGIQVAKKRFFNR